MIRGTTPTHTFTFDNFDPSTFKVLNVYYAQQGVEVITKEKSDCSFSSEETDNGTIYSASITLTQEETKMFKAKYNVEIQLRVLTADDKALATPKYEISVWDVINDEILE